MGRPPTGILTSELHRGKQAGRISAAAAILAGCGLMTSLGCTGVVNGAMGSGGSGPLAGGGSSGSAGQPSAVGGGGSGGSGTSGACSSTLDVPTRLARIGDAQIANAIRGVFGAEVQTAVTVADPTTRDFIPIQDSLSSSVLDRYVQTAETAMDAVTDQTIAKLGGCATATLDDACAKNAIALAAEKFYRRPVTADELASLTTVYTDTSTYGIPIATRAALSAILTAPPTMYRTEFGSGVVDGKTSLTSYEVASELSFMLADTIPDDELLAAAKADKLKSADDIRAQVDRLLGTPAVQANLTRVMLANYSIGSLFGTAKDAKLFPAYTPALETSLYTETQLFIDNVLWRGKITDLLTSRQTYIDEGLAALYNVTYPAAAGSGFQPYTFGPNERAGLLTQGSVLSIAANPDNTSVVHRGLFVHGKIMCLGVNPPPASLQSQINALSTENITEKAKADFRAQTSPCNACHLTFDQYGLTMEHYDAIGRYREAYPDGTPIDSSVTLPRDVGGAVAQGVTEMASALAGNPVFVTCVAQQLTGYGLGFQLDSSAAQGCSIAKTYATFMSAGSGTFTDMIRAVATSDALLVRKASQ